MDTTQWLTIKEAATESGLSERTIERRVEQQKITVGERKIPGSKPVIVLPPDEVQALKTPLRSVLQASPKSSHPPMREHGKTPKRQPDMGTILKAIERLRMPIDRQLNLTDREAALYLGLSVTEVRRFADNHVIPSWRNSKRQRMFRRTDVEAYTPTSRQVTYQNGGVREDSNVNI